MCIWASQFTPYQHILMTGQSYCIYQPNFTPHHTNQRTNGSGIWSSVETYVLNIVWWWKDFLLNAMDQKTCQTKPLRPFPTAPCSGPWCADKKAPACSPMAHFYCWLRVLSHEWKERLWENQAWTLLTHLLVNSADLPATKSLFIPPPKQRPAAAVSACLSVAAHPRRHKAGQLCIYMLYNEMLWNAAILFGWLVKSFEIMMVRWNFWYFNWKTQV